MKQKATFKETEIGIIPEDWDIVPAETFCLRVTDGTHDSPKKQEQGKYLITSRHLKDGYLDFSNAYYITEEDFMDANRRSKVDRWDVLFSMIGTIGEVYIEKSEKINYAIKNVGLFKSGGESLKGRWVYYYLKSKCAKEYIRKARAGTTQEYITLESLRKFPIVFPKNKIEMQEIEYILDSMCDKLDVNKLINETLEKIAQALFKRWFVDFEFPNERGKPYRSSGGVMVDSELGEIPKGWAVEKLGNVVSINQKSMTGDYAEKVIQYVDISSVSEGKLQNVTTYEIGEAPSRAKRLVSHGDIIWSCVRPNRKSYLFIYRPPKNLVVSTGFVVLTPKANSRSYFYCRVTSDEFVDYLSANADGSAYPAVRPEHFAMADMVIPPAPLLDRFETAISPLREAIAYNEEQSRTLSHIRDMLLPRLMSGRIRVPVEVAA